MLDSLSVGQWYDRTVPRDQWEERERFALMDRVWAVQKRRRVELNELHGLLREVRRRRSDSARSTRPSVLFGSALPLLGFAVYYVAAAIGSAKWALANGWNPVVLALTGPFVLAYVFWPATLIIGGLFLAVGATIDERRGTRS